MANTVNIKFLGWGAGAETDVRTPVRQIPAVFTPDGSYVDIEKDDVKILGIYATNVWQAILGITAGLKNVAGLDPLGTATSKLGAFAIAVRLYEEAQASGDEYEGYTFTIDDYRDEIYWKQLAYAESIEGNFNVTVTAVEAASTEADSTEGTSTEAAPSEEAADGGEG